jgi:hypothetical protein
METSTMLVAAVLALGVFYVAVPVALDAYRRYHGTKTVICPETGMPAHVEVDATAASISAALGRPRVEVARCTHWPEREHCGQDCLKQLEAHPGERAA